MHYENVVSTQIALKCSSAATACTIVRPVFLVDYSILLGCGSPVGVLNLYAFGFSFRVGQHDASVSLTFPSFDPLVPKFPGEAGRGEMIN